MRTTIINCDRCGKKVTPDEKIGTPIVELQLSIRHVGGHYIDKVCGVIQYDEVCLECAKRIKEEFGKSREES